VNHAPIGLWLAASSLVSAAALALGLVPGGLRELRELSEENAQQRVLLALEGAERQLEDTRAAARTQARVLAERPTLAALLRSGRTVELVEFLAAFRVAAGLEGCAVMRDGSPVAAAPSHLDWSSLSDVPRMGAACIRALKPGRSGEGSTAALSSVVATADVLDADAWVVATLALEAPGNSASEGAVQVDWVLGMTSADEEPRRTQGGDWLGLRRVTSAADGVPLSARAVLGVEDAERALAAAERRFFMTTLVTGLVAALLATLGSQRLARPFTALGVAAERIGRGDLVSAVPRAGSREARALGAALDEMRIQLAEARTRLEQREAEARALLGGMSEGVLAVDRDRIVRTMTPRAAEILRVEAAESLGRFCGDVFHPSAALTKRPCATACPIVDARARGSSRAVERIERRGSIASVVVTSAPPTGDHQVLVIRDESEIEAARRARDAFLANVTHELRTPLSAQLASIELMRDSLARAGVSAPLELVDSLQRSTLRLAQLVDDLLESVRIESGRTSHRHDAIQLLDLVSEVEEALQPLVHQAGLSVAVDSPIDLPEVEGDSVQLRQVLVNLMANAIRHSPPGGKLRFELRSLGDSVRICVEDEGLGVPEHLSAAIFERHRRGEQGGSGLGLGLWIARSIIERHGGRITVDRGPRLGARFCVELPRGGAL